MRTDRQLIAPRFLVLAAPLANHLEGRDAFARTERLDDDFVSVAGELVDLLADIFALDEVVELHLAGNRGQDGRCEGVPLHQWCPWIHILSVLNQQVRSVGHGVALLLTLASIEDYELAGSGDCYRLAIFVLDCGNIEELDLARMIGDVT